MVVRLEALIHVVFLFVPIRQIYRLQLPDCLIGWFLIVVISYIRATPSYFFRLLSRRLEIKFYKKMLENALAKRVLSPEKEIV